MPALTSEESVYCISEQQMRRALELARDDPRSAPLLAGKIAELQAQLSRNERAALAFLLIDRLKRSPL